MSNLALVEFDELPRGAGGVGATEAIARTLTASGIDAPTSLYDEALALAREGRLAPSAERLRMLLCLDPSDADAALLLGKVLAARNQWQEAIAALDAASSNGAVLPAGLRENVDAALRQQVQEDEEHRARVAARERGEIKNLRNEAKRLRSDNAALEQQVGSLQKRVRLWSSLAAVVAGSAAALAVAAVLVAGPSAAPSVAAEPMPPESAPAEAIRAPLPEAVATVSSSPTLAPEAAPAPLVESLPPTARTHTIRRGETLGSLAGRYYGRSSDWKRILDANPDVLHGKNRLAVGMKLVIPE